MHGTCPCVSIKNPFCVSVKNPFYLKCHYALASACTHIYREHTLSLHKKHILSLHKEHILTKDASTPSPTPLRRQPPPFSLLHPAHPPLTNALCNSNFFSGIVTALMNEKADK